MTAVRRSAEWMTLLDDRILDYLAANDTGTARLVSETGTIPNVDVGDVSDRMHHLEKVDLIRRIHNRTFEITARGRQYRSGELDASNLQPPVLHKG